LLLLTNKVIEIKAEGREGTETTSNPTRRDKSIKFKEKCNLPSRPGGRRRIKTYLKRFKK
jgi:hypothetical protein